MVIAPSGKRRLMVAQTYTDPTLHDEDAEADGLETNDGVEDSIHTDQLEQEVETVEREEEVPEEGTDEADLTDFIFKKLQTLGFEGRRLREFRNKFVNETITADGDKEIELVIPANYGPKFGRRANSRIGDKDFSSLVKEVAKRFNLYFDGAQKADDKLNIKFTSVNKNTQESLVEEDALSKVYGQPSKSESDSQGVAASTLTEMIKESKNSVLDSLLQSLEKKAC